MTGVAWSGFLAIENGRRGSPWIGRRRRGCTRRASHGQASWRWGMAAGAHLGWGLGGGAARDGNRSVSILGDGERPPTLTLDGPSVEGLHATGVLWSVFSATGKGGWGSPSMRRLRRGSRRFAIGAGLGQVNFVMLFDPQKTHLYSSGGVDEASGLRLVGPALEAFPTLSTQVESVGNSFFGCKIMLG